MTSRELAPSGEGLPGPFWRPGARFPSFYDRANSVLPPTSSTWTWVTRRRTPRHQLSWKVRVATDFPGTAPDPAGLWPTASGLQSFRLGIWASFGALSFRAFLRKFGPSFRGIAKSPEDFSPRRTEFPFRSGISRPVTNFPNRGSQRGPARFGRVNPGDRK